MGKMPEGLRKYRAKHGRGRKVRRKVRRVVGVTRRRYFGRRRGGRTRRTVPILGIATAGAIGAGILLNDSGYGVPITSLKKGDVTSAGGQALANLTNAKTYAGAIVPLVLWIVCRMLLGKKAISKRVSIA